MALFSTSKTPSSTPPYTNPLFSIEPIFPVLIPCIPGTRPCHVAHFSTRKAPSPSISSLQPVYLSLVYHLFNNPCLWIFPHQLTFASKLFAQSNCPSYWVWGLVQNRKGSPLISESFEKVTLLHMIIHLLFPKKEMPSPPYILPVPQILLWVPPIIWTLKTIPVHFLTQ